MNRLLTTFIALAAAAAAPAQTVNVTTDIAVSTTWIASNTYNLVGQIFVLPGATLTVQAGTVIAGSPGSLGTLAVTRGAQIHIQGTATQPVIMTSTADVSTWTGGDPKTGTWREASAEWGNLTLLGRGYISADATVGNVATPDASNVATMQGLVASGPGDTRVLYGGGDDGDDSGTISYLSLRYGGKVLGLGNQLSGLSLGGVGRGTEIHHVEVMNAIDDGIEIFGGTVDLRYFSIWNVGDDGFDVDQGWRGTAQFGLIVQGYCLDAPQGSGVGDNVFELDGAEDSHWQPVTTATICNCTTVGQPLDGDGSTAWRDNARVQFYHSLFLDGGEQVVRFDNSDGTHSGYGHAGTLSWPATWTTDYTVTSPVNAPPNPAPFYLAQTAGKLSQFADSVFYGNSSLNAYTEADARGVFASGNNNLKEPPGLPIAGLSRGPMVTKGLKLMRPVRSIDPRPTLAALTSAGSVPAGCGLNAVSFRGGFAPGDNWLYGWTASHAFGLSVPTLLTDALTYRDHSRLYRVDLTSQASQDISVHWSPGQRPTILQLEVTPTGLPPITVTGMSPLTAVGVPSGPATIVVRALDLFASRLEFGVQVHSGENVREPNDKIYAFEGSSNCEGDCPASNADAEDLTAEITADNNWSKDYAIAYQHPQAVKLSRVLLFTRGDGAQSITAQIFQSKTSGDLGNAISLPVNIQPGNLLQWWEKPLQQSSAGSLSLAAGKEFYIKLTASGGTTVSLPYLIGDDDLERPPSRSFSGSTWSPRMSNTGWAICFVCEDLDTGKPTHWVEADILLGTTIQLRVAKLNTASPTILMIATTPTATPDLAFLGAPGCKAILPILTLPTITNPSGTRSIPVMIPNLPSLAGDPFYTQWVGTGGSNAAHITLSNVLELRAWQ